MKCTARPPREYCHLSLKLHSPRLFFKRLSSFGLAVVVLAGASVALAAQQTNIGHPDAVAPATSATPSPEPNPAPQNDPAAAKPSSTDATTPSTHPAQSAQDDSSGHQTKRILGIVPNFRAVSAGTKLPPETSKEKFMSATQDSFDYSSVFFPAVIAAYNMAERKTPEFHQGAAGYARYFWHSAVDQTSENYMVEFIFPIVTREDSRYYTLGHGGFVKRTGYALSRAVITRSNSGNEVFNISEVFGAGSAAGLSNLYYPSSSRSAGATSSQWGLDVGIDAGVFWFREFWPDINRHIFRNKYSDPSPEK